MMHEAVLPNMTTPVLLADYLTRAVDQGGATGMLALHALFLLMSRHGLEYPAFFQRLYSLLTPAMFKVGDWSARDFPAQQEWLALPCRRWEHVTHLQGFECSCSGST